MLCSVTPRQPQYLRRQLVELVPVFTSTNGAAHLTQDEEDDPDYQDDDADRHQNADAQDPAQDQQDETKNYHVILLEC